MPKQKVECQCGGILSQPVPEKCPHCGAKIIAVRRQDSLPYVPILIVFGLFVAMIVFVVWMIGRG